MLVDGRTFPFGQPLKPVLHQTDGLPKRAFVLGIYSSAVHARWIGPDGRSKVSALAVASEPSIFWLGQNAASFVPLIDSEMGRLEPAEQANNGPSGRALDEKYLTPLGIDRSMVWLSDMVPYSLSNRGQQAAILRHYEPMRQRFGLPKSSIPLVPKSATEWHEHVDVERIMNELEQSGARTIITLGNLPIKYFLNRVGDVRKADLILSDYGTISNMIIRSQKYRVLSLAHMRVTEIRPIARWRDAHEEWRLSTSARGLLY